ncbi:MAG: hypothetical protein EZS28_002777 [Streblomastix strix]|uniref:Uncharacterized protein n=1 Tax=Streblomastix strix TaxID=222440 RepID=A0A5J4X4H7_9EUKA|nr:MAG: hypothetical protein EZS28_002777 [Streblomastix strix]
MSHAIQPLHTLRLMQELGSQDFVNSQAGQYSATAMGPGQQIAQLVTVTSTQIVQQFYSGQLISRPQIQQPFQGFGMYPGIQQFQGFPQPGLFQQIQPSGYGIYLYRQPSIIEGLPQFMQSPPTFGLQKTQESNLLILPVSSLMGYPAFQSSFQSQNFEQLNQQYNQQSMIRLPTLVQQQQSQVQEPIYVNGRLLDSPGTALTRKIVQDQQPLQNRESLQRTDQSQFTPIDPPQLSIILNQQQFNAHRDFWTQRSQTLRYFGLKATGEHHRGFGESLLNVSVFIQRYARHEHITINDWKAFWREVDTDLYLDSVRMDLDKDGNHHHYHNHHHDHDRNHRHDKERNDSNNQLDLGRGRKRKIVISSEGSDNGQSNDEWTVGPHREVERYRLRQFRIRRNRREQALPPVQTVSGESFYMTNLLTAQEEAFRRINNIYPNLNEESSVS